MVDKVKPLKFENSATGGTEIDAFPSEADPTEDYLSGKGISFEHSDSHLAEKLGDILGFKKPDFSCAPSFNADGTLNYLDYFIGNTQTTPNRRARVSMAYDGNLDPATETWRIYSPSDGTAVLRTVTYTYTFGSSILSSVTEGTA